MHIKPEYQDERYAEAAGYLKDLCDRASSFSKHTLLEPLIVSAAAKPGIKKVLEHNAFFDSARLILVNEAMAESLALLIDTALEALKAFPEQEEDLCLFTDEHLHSCITVRAARASLTGTIDEKTKISTELYDSIITQLDVRTGKLIIKMFDLTHHEVGIWIKTTGIIRACMNSVKVTAGYDKATRALVLTTCPQGESQLVSILRNLSQPKALSESAIVEVAQNVISYFHHSHSRAAHHWHNMNHVRIYLQGVGMQGFFGELPSLESYLKDPKVADDCLYNHIATVQAIATHASK